MTIMNGLQKSHILTKACQYIAFIVDIKVNQKKMQRKVNITAVGSGLITQNEHDVIIVL